MKDNYCVYMHKCNINEKVYIGYTNNVERRWRNNGIEYKPPKGRENTRPFWNAIVKYGWDNFEHIILEDNLTKEQAEEKEKYYINKFNSRDKEVGYNVAEGGNGGRIYIEHPRGYKGHHRTEEEKEQARQRMKRLNDEGKCGAVWKNGHPKGMKGKVHSEETKQQISKTLKENPPFQLKLKATLPNGDIIYGNRMTLAEELKISTNLVDKILKSNKPYKVAKNTSINKEYLLTLEGLKIEKITDNTELTRDIA